MADEINNEQASVWLSQINLGIRQLNENLKSKDALNSVGNLKKALKESNLSDEDTQKVISKQGLMELGYDSEDADIRIAANTELQRLREKQEELNRLQEQFGGLSAKDSTTQDQIEFDIDRMLEIQKFGRELTKLDKTFLGGLDRLQGSLEEQSKKGEIGLKGAIGGLGSDLRGDVDKITAFLGPAASALSNLPFLGTIVNFGTKLVKQGALQLLNIVRGWKEGKKQHKEIVKIEKKKSKADRKKLEAQNRAATKAKGLTPKKDGTPDKRFKAAKGGDDDDGNGLFGAAAGAAALGMTASVFNPVTMTAFVSASALAAVGLGLLGTGIAAFMSMVGLGAGVLIYKIMRGFARGFAEFDETGATDALARLEKLDLMKIAGGLAALAGTSMLNSIAGLLALLPGDEAPYTKLGEDAAGFANAVNGSGFMDIDTAAFGEKTSALFGPSVKSSFAGVLDFFKGDATPLTDLGSDAAGFANAVKPFEDMDVDTFTTNIEKIKSVMSNFELPENKDGLLKSMFGEGGVDQLKDLAGIRFADAELGSKLEKLGTGVDMVSSGLDSLTTDKAAALGRLGYEIGKNFDNFNLNFGTIPQTAGAGADMTIAEGEMQPNITMVNTVSSPTTNTNVRRQYAATGVTVNHSRAHSSLP